MAKYLKKLHKNEDKLLSETLRYRENVLFCESVDLSRLTCMLQNSELGQTPLFVYSKKQLVQNILDYKQAFADRSSIVAYALKANSNIEILRLILEHDLSIGAVSGYEVQLCLEMGFPGRRIFFNGNGKHAWEMRLALKNNCVMNVDSVFNARQLVDIVEKDWAYSCGKDTNGNDSHEAEIAEAIIRISVDVESANMPPHLQTTEGIQTSKFGIMDEDFRQVLDILSTTKKIKVIGVHCHFGDNIEDVSVYAQMFALAEKTIRENEARLADVRIINIGGGLGINYSHDENKSPPPTVGDLCKVLPKRSPYIIMVEPGRSMVGNAGLLLTKVMGIKSTMAKNFVVVDGSMTEVIRPALYQAYHHILPVVDQRIDHEIVDVVGPVCEWRDFLGRDRRIGMPKEGDLLALLATGAYCMSMASNYNLRARPAEVMVDGESVRVIRRRETFQEVVGMMQMLMMNAAEATRIGYSDQGQPGPVPGPPPPPPTATTTTTTQHRREKENTIGDQETEKSARSLRKKKN